MEIRYCDPNFETRQTQATSILLSPNYSTVLHGKSFGENHKKRLEFVLEKEPILSPWQCGFSKGQGTMDVLLRVENEIRETLSNNSICLILYIDLKSAFDTVWGEGLVYKLAKSGIKGKMIKWLTNYFSDRFIKVFFEGTSSDSVALKAGTPQGAVMSPLLFNAMLSDIPEDQNVKIHIYADDITISCSDADPITVKRNMQQYIQKFAEWADRWGLIINPQKTKMQHFTKKRMTCPILRIHNQVIEYVKEQRILGMIMDSPSLNWKAHIDYVKSDCLKRLDLIKVFSSPSYGASTRILRNFYISYVRAKLDYGASLYASASKTNLKKLEIVQNGSLRCVLGARSSTPINSLEVESCVPPLKIHRDYLTVKQYIKLKHKPENDHTIKILNINMHRNMAYKYPFQSVCNRACKMLRTYELSSLKRIPAEIVDMPPWLSVQEHVVCEAAEKILDNNAFTEYTSDHYPNFKFLFSDGSKRIVDGTEFTSAGIYIPDQNRSICWKLRGSHSVISAELFGIWQALLQVE